MTKSQRIEDLRKVLETGQAPKNDPRRAFEAGKLCGQLMNVMTQSELTQLANIDKTNARKPLE